MARNASRRAAMSGRANRSRRAASERSWLRATWGSSRPEVRSSSMSSRLSAEEDVAAAGAGDDGGDEEGAGEGIGREEGGNACDDVLMRGVSHEAAEMQGVKRASPRFCARGWWMRDDFRGRRGRGAGGSEGAWRAGAFGVFRAWRATLPKCSAPAAYRGAARGRARARG